MKSAARCLLVAALASSACAAHAQQAFPDSPRTSTAAFAEVDTMLGEAQHRVTGLEDLKAAVFRGGSAAEGIFVSSDPCNALSIDRVMEMPEGRNALPPQLATLQNLIVQHSFRYYTCRGFASGETRVCDRLAPFEDFAVPHPVEECRRYAKELVFAHALMTGGSDLHRLCLEDLIHPEDNEFRPDDYAKVCRLVLKRWRDPMGLCGELEPMFLKKRQLVKCQTWFSALNGDGAGCDALGENDVRERCVAYAAFSKARSGGGTKACGDSAICLAFMGEGPKACELYARRILPPICEKMADQRVTQGELIHSLLDKAGAMLTKGGPYAGSRHEIEERRRRAAAIAERFRSVEKGYPSP